MNERLSKIISHPATIPVCVGVVSFASGVGVGFMFGRKNRKQLYENNPKLDLDLTVDDIAEVRENNKPEPVVIDETTFEAIREADKIIAGADFVEDKIKELPSIDIVTEAELITKNIFAGTDDEWNYEEELEKRKTGFVYILHRDEFFADELKYAQHTLTYYSGDNIMVDEDNTPVYNHAIIVGPLVWGHGSGDPNVVYIRNDKLKTEYEILRDDGLYSQEILGLEIEHNERARDVKLAEDRKFRQE